VCDFADHIHECVEGFRPKQVGGHARLGARDDRGFVVLTDAEGDHLGLWVCLADQLQKCAVGAVGDIEQHDIRRRRVG
jgi:hypothetical protein